MLHPFSRLFTLLALLGATLGFTDHPATHSKPYFAHGAAQFAANQSDFTGSGQATHLGRYTEVGNVTFTPTSTPGVFAVSGETTYTAANGDDLDASVAGFVDMVTGAITATATYDGGTGRFTDATGASALVGQMLGGGALTMTASGVIDY